MLDTLHAVERDLPQLLTSAAGWNSLRIDYHPPFVDRVWRDWGEYRISLHCISPCEPDASLFHPHPWPSAMRILEGQYEMTVSYGQGDTAPPVAAKLIASGPMEYEMVDENAWHAVRPIGGVAWTLMVTGKPWSRSAPRSERPLHALPPERIEEILARFRGYYRPSSSLKEEAG